VLQHYDLAFAAAGAFHARTLAAAAAAAVVPTTATAAATTVTGMRQLEPRQGATSAGKRYTYDDNQNVSSEDTLVRAGAEAEAGVSVASPAGIRGKRSNSDAGATVGSLGGSSLQGSPYSSPASQQRQQQQQREQNGMALLASPTPTSPSQALGAFSPDAKLLQASKRSRSGAAGAVGFGAGAGVGTGTAGSGGAETYETGGGGGCVGDTRPAGGSSLTSSHSELFPQLVSSPAARALPPAFTHEEKDTDYGSYDRSSMESRSTAGGDAYLFSLSSARDSSRSLPGGVGLSVGSSGGWDDITFASPDRPPTAKSRALLHQQAQDKRGGVGGGGGGGGGGGRVGGAGVGVDVASSMLAQAQSQQQAQQQRKQPLTAHAAPSPDRSGPSSRAVARYAHLVLPNIDDQEEEEAEAEGGEESVFANRYRVGSTGGTVAAATAGGGGGEKERRGIRSLEGTDRFMGREGREDSDGGGGAAEEAAEERELLARGESKDSGDHNESSGMSYVPVPFDQYVLRADGTVVAQARAVGDDSPIVRRGRNSGVSGAVPGAVLAAPFTTSVDVGKAVKGQVLESTFNRVPESSGRSNGGDTSTTSQADLALQELIASCVARSAQKQQERAELRKQEVSVSVFVRGGRLLVEVSRDVSQLIGVLTVYLFVVLAIYRMFQQATIYAHDHHLDTADGWSDATTEYFPHFLSK
jgi:hypothetical protein